MARAEEHAIQSNFHALFRLAKATPVVDGFSIPNERSGAVSRAQLGRLIARGMLPGAPDYIIVWSGDGVTPLDRAAACRCAFLEFKASKGRERANQSEFADRVGRHYALVRSVEEAFAAVEGWGVPLWRVYRGGDLVMRERV